MLTEPDETTLTCSQAIFSQQTLMTGGGGERRGLGPRDDVLTTCKAVTLRVGQRVIEVSFPQ